MLTRLWHRSRFADGLVGSDERESLHDGSGADDSVSRVVGIIGREG